MALIDPAASPHDQVVPTEPMPARNRFIQGLDKAIEHHHKGYAVGCVLLFLGTGILIPLGTRVSYLGLGRVATWLAAILGLLLFMVVCGHGLQHGRWDGLLIDERNKVSLSRLQWILWMLIVPTGFWAALMVNLVQNGYHLVDGKPVTYSGFAIAIPAQLLQVLGISAISTVAAPMILSQKPATETGRANAVQANRDAGKAGWSELVKGDLQGTYRYLDLGKVQLLFFTLILVVGYAFTLYQLLHSTAIPFAGFPSFDAGIVALLGISHAGYLGAKVTAPITAGQGTDTEKIDNR